MMPRGHAERKAVMRIRVFAAILVIAGSTCLASGCGSGTSTARAEITACDAFESWMGGTGGDPLQEQYAHYLTQAVNDAPSGTLHQELSKLASDAHYVTTPAGENSNAAARTVISDADLVNSVCGSVLPSASP
jgi:hypothetical protein